MKQPTKYSWIYSYTKASKQVAIQYDIEKIEEKLNSLTTKQEKLNYLNKYLFKLRKKESEFIATDSKTLKRLKIQTANDYEKYHNEFDRGGLIYFNNVHDSITAKRIGFENVELLKKRLRLEFTLSDLTGRIKLFEALIKRVKNEEIDVNNDGLSDPQQPMGKSNDTRFLLTSFYEEQAQKTYEYEKLKRLIENDGSFVVKIETETVKIYTPDLALILLSEKLASRNLDTQEVIDINGSDYLDTYIEAYRDGVKYFDTEYAISPNILYGANAEQYVRDIHHNFFHIGRNGTNEGWQFVKKKAPIILTHRSIREFGYHAGIVNKVEELIKKHPRLFQTFDKCEHEFIEPKPKEEQFPQEEKQVDEHLTDFMEAKMQTLHQQSELREKERERRRKEEMKLNVDKNYNYSPTIEDFNEELDIQRKNPNIYKYLLFLRKAKKIYGNANSYYVRWGATGTGVDRSELYTNILSLIDVELTSLKNNLPVQQQLNPEIKPIFSPEKIDTVFKLLKDFFSKNQQPLLRKILETGDDASEFLIFLGNGNRLADAFKQLIKADVITGCHQKELENWIGKNFKFRYRKKIKAFTPRYLNSIISTNKDLCRHPILNVTKQKATGNIVISKA